VRVWPVAGGAAVTPLLEHDSEVLSAVFHPQRQLLVTGTSSGRLRFWDLPSGGLVRTIQGKGACQGIVFDEAGDRVAAVFADGAGIWDVASGLPITDRLWHGSRIEGVAFHGAGTQLLLWAGVHQPGLASIWDVSLIGEKDPGLNLDGAQLMELVAAFGGKRLDASSQLQAATRSSVISVLDSFSGTNRTEQFFGWLRENPGTRAESPFRPRASEVYVDKLVDQDDARLLEEAVRLRPRFPRALAKRALLRAGLEDPNNRGPRCLSYADMSKAHLLALKDPEVHWYRAMTCRGQEGERSWNTSRGPQSPGVAGTCRPSRRTDPPGCGLEVPG